MLSFWAASAIESFNANRSGIRRTAPNLNAASNGLRSGFFASLNEVRDVSEQ
jgi:hypothetical protein